MVRFPIATLFGYSDCADYFPDYVGWFYFGERSIIKHANEVLPDRPLAESRGKRAAAKLKLVIVISFIALRWLYLVRLL